MEMQNVKAEFLARVLGLTPQRVGQLSKSGVLKRDANKRYFLPDALESYYEFRAKADASMKSRLDYRLEHTRLEAIKRETAEIELGVIRGDLLFAANVEAAMATTILTCKARLLVIPTKCAPRVLGQKSLSVIQDLLQREICEALDELKPMPAPPG